MGPILGTALGGLAGLVVGGFLTNPVVGPNLFVAKPLPKAPDGTEGTACGPGVFGDNGPCKPPLVCGPGILQGTCVQPTYQRDVIMLTAACTLAGAGIGYLLTD